MHNFGGPGVSRFICRLGPSQVRTKEEVRQDDMSLIRARTIESIPWPIICSGDGIAGKLLLVFLKQ